VKSDDCTVVLAHNPDTALYARHLKPGVMLSGHTHGGVVRIPFYGSPLKSILRIGKQFYSGLNRYEDFYIYTNRGLGTFWLRIRINCPPRSLALHVDAFPRCGSRREKLCRMVRCARRSGFAVVEHRGRFPRGRIASTSSREGSRDARSRDRRSNHRHAGWRGSFRRWHQRRENCQRRAAGNARVSAKQYRRSGDALDSRRSRSPYASRC